MDTLYHFTCDHGRRDIGTGNCLLLPFLHPWIGKKLIWLTSVATPDRQRTGLTMKYQGCDRMRFRYIVDDLTHCRRWLDSPERASLDEKLRDSFEVLEDGRQAACDEWWISTQPIRARFDRSYQI